MKHFAPHHSYCAIAAACALSAVALAEGSKSAPADLHALSTAGIELAGQGKWADAVAKFNQVLAKKPGDAMTLGARATCYLQLGRVDEALADVAKAEAADKRLSDGLEASVAEFFLDRGKGRVDERDTAGARADLNRAAKHPQTRARAYAELAYVDSMTGDAKSCVNNATLAIQADARVPDGYANRSSCLSALSKDADALVDLNQAVAIAPASAGFWLSRASLQARLSHCKEARADAKEASRLDGSFAAAAEKIATDCK